MSRRRLQAAAFLAAALVVLLAAGAAFGLRLPGLFGGTTYNGGLIDPPIQLPALTLQRANGRQFTTADTKGHVSLVFFGYTNCPDVCPMTLAQLAQVRRQLGERSNRVDVYFVTVDPDRDTPQRLTEYTAGFDPAIVGLTGSAAELDQAQRAFGVVAEKRAAAEGADPSRYFADHSATIYLVDPDSRVRLVYPPDAPAAQMAEDVRRVQG